MCWVWFVRARLLQAVRANEGNTAHMRTYHRPHVSCACACGLWRCVCGSGVTMAAWQDGMLAWCLAKQAWRPIFCPARNHTARLLIPSLLRPFCSVSPHQLSENFLEKEEYHTARYRVWRDIGYDIIQYYIEMLQEDTYIRLYPAYNFMNEP